MTASFGNLLHQLPGLQMLRSNILCCSPLIFTSSFLDFISSSKLKFHSWQNNSWNLLHLRKSRSWRANLPRWLNLADYATLPPSPDSPWPFIPYPRNPAYAAARGNRHAMPPTPPVSFVELEDISSDGKFTLCALAAFEKRQHVLLWDCWDFVSTPF